MNDLIESAIIVAVIYAVLIAAVEIADNCGVRQRDHRDENDVPAP